MTDQTSRPGKEPLRINFIGNYGPDYSYCRYMARAGHESLFYTDLKVHPRLSIAYYHKDIDDDDIFRIRIEDMLSTSHLNLNVHAQDILRKVSNCHALHVNGMYGIWGALSGKPYIYKPFGGDINHWPFLYDTELERLRAWYMRVILSKATILLGFLHQKKYKRVINKLGLDQSRVRGWCFPMDADKYRPLPPNDWIGLRQAYESTDKFVIFLPSQLMMHPTREMQYTKGSDVFAKGVKAFLDQVGTENALLWVIDKGPQKKEFHEIVEAIGLSGSIRWIKPQQSAEFIHHLNAADVILDQINPDIGNHGYICIEGMSCGKPVLTHVDNAYRVKIAGEPFLPHVEVLTQEDVCDQLLWLYRNQYEREAVGRKGREFVLQYHHWPKACERFSEIFREAITLHAKQGENLHG